MSYIFKQTCTLKNNFIRFKMYNSKFIIIKMFFSKKTQNTCKKLMQTFKQFYQFLNYIQ